MSHLSEGTAVVKASYLEDVHKAEEDLRIALAQTQRVIEDYFCMAPSNGDFALDNALKLQHQAMEGYVAACRLFTKSMLEGALADKESLVKPSDQRKQSQSRARGRLKPLVKNGGAA
jgi:hypothetical protein